MIVSDFLLLMFAVLFATQVPLLASAIFTKPKPTRTLVANPLRWSMGEQAILTGGPRRAWETWAIALLGAGHLSIEFPSKSVALVSRAGHSAPQDPELLALWQALPATGTHTPKQLAACWSAHTQSACDSLVAKGALLQGPPPRLPWWTLLISAAGVGAMITGIQTGNWQVWAPVTIGLVLGQVLNIILRPDRSRYLRDQVSEHCALQVFNGHALARRTPERENLHWAVASGGLITLAGTPYAGLAYPSKSKNQETSGGDGGVLFLPLGDGGSSSIPHDGTSFSTGDGFGGGGFSSGDSSSDGGSSGCGGGCGGD